MDLDLLFSPAIAAFHERFAQTVAACAEPERPPYRSYLSTYFSPNTHLLGEAWLYFFIGTLFPGLESAARWRQRGWKILEREAAKQVREDGFYFEQSTYYHVYALDMFLHGRILADLNGVEIPTEFRSDPAANVECLVCCWVAPEFRRDLAMMTEEGYSIHGAIGPSTCWIRWQPVRSFYGRGDFKFLARRPAGGDAVAAGRARDLPNSLHCPPLRPSG